MMPPANIAAVDAHELEPLKYGKPPDVPAIVIVTAPVEEEFVTITESPDHEETPPPPAPQAAAVFEMSPTELIWRQALPPPP
jgi:hypothetical protein